MIFCFFKADFFIIQRLIFCFFKVDFSVSSFYFLKNFFDVDLFSSLIIFVFMVEALMSLTRGDQRCRWSVHYNSMGYGLVRLGRVEILLFGVWAREALKRHFVVETKQERIGGVGNVWWCMCKLVFEDTRSVSRSPQLRPSTWHLVTSLRR